MKLLRVWLKKGPNPNLVHSMHLLEAEKAALQGKKAEAEYNFKRAISVATKNGFLHDKALAHDLGKVSHGNLIQIGAPQQSHSVLHKYDGICWHVKESKPT